MYGRNRQINPLSLAMQRRRKMFGWLPTESNIDASSMAIFSLPHSSKEDK